MFRGIQLWSLPSNEERTRTVTNIVETRRREDDETDDNDEDDEEEEQGWRQNTGGKRRRTCGGNTVIAAIIISNSDFNSTTQNLSVRYRTVSIFRGTVRYTSATLPRICEASRGTIEIGRTHNGRQYLPRFQKSETMRSK